MEPQPTNPMTDQAQAILDKTLGEDAGAFKDLLGMLGVNDREFWKGAMVGAAAALLIGNEDLRGKLMEMLAGASALVKTQVQSTPESGENGNQERNSMMSDKRFWQGTLVGAAATLLLTNKKVRSNRCWCGCWHWPIWSKTAARQPGKKRVVRPIPSEKP